MDGTTHTDATTSLLEDFREFLLFDVRKGGVDSLALGVFCHCFPDEAARLASCVIVYGAHERPRRVQEELLHSMEQRDLVIIVSDCTDRVSERLELAGQAKKHGADRVCLFAHHVHFTTESRKDIRECKDLDWYVVSDLPAGGRDTLYACPTLHCFLPEREYVEPDHRNERLFCSPKPVAGI